MNHETYRILIVEDSEDDMLLLLRTLRQGGYAVDYGWVDNEEDLRIALPKEWDIVISDFSMPTFNGMDALRAVREYDDTLPFLLLSGAIGEDDAVQAMKAGANDYIMKGNKARLLPAVEREIRESRDRRRHHQLEESFRSQERLAAQALQKAYQDLAVAYDSTLLGWAMAVQLRDQDTGVHSEQVTAMALELAEALGYPAEEMIHLKRGALLHDVGKLGIPDAILLKQGPLTDEEWLIMKKHPVYAYQWLQAIEYLHPALDIPYAHHEKWDGSGYPRGLSGEDIPLAARIFAVVDVWEALCSDRPYRKAWPPEKAKAHIANGSGTHFDPAVVDCFVKLLEQGAFQSQKSSAD